jgi:hypothetical protein
MTRRKPSPKSAPNRRSQAIRLTLLPLLASAALARAQAWPGSDCPPGYPGCPSGSQEPSESQYQNPYPYQPNPYPYDWYDYWYDPSYIVVPIQRDGFGSYFWIGTGG